MNKRKQIYTIITVILLIILLICGIYYYKSNNEKQKININIDNSKLNIFYFYVGNADCILITNNNQTMLIDAGNKSDGKLIANYLKQLQISKIDYFIGTHSDSDHIGGMAYIIDSFKIENIYLQDKGSDTLTYTNLIETIGNSQNKDNKDLILKKLERGEKDSIRKCRMGCEMGRK